MPFEQSVSLPFVSLAVQTYAPVTSGVYGISNAREWIYIGESDNIRSSLLGHLQSNQTPLMKSEPTGFVFETCDKARRAQRQDRLVVEYEPVCNRQPAQPL